MSGSTGGPVTRADVAAAAGVSPAVVSYVLNNGPRPVAPDTRKRVEVAIRALGYRPDAVAAALRRGKSRMVGLLTSSPTNPFFAEQSMAFVDAAVERGQAMAIGISDQPFSRGRMFLRSLADHRIDGVIVAVDGAPSGHAAELRRMTVVAMSRDAAAAVDEGVPVVTFDHAHAAQLATEHLVQHGHTSIACVAGPWQLQTSDERVEGWRAGCERLGIFASEALVERAEFTADGGRLAMMKLLGPHPRHPSSRRPTAVFVSSDIQAFGALQACAQLGLRVPDDVAIVSIDGTAMARLANPSLSTVRQPQRDLADAALDVLAQRQRGENPTDLTVRIPGNLVVARSCGCTEANDVQFDGLASSGSVGGADAHLQRNS